MTETLLTKHVPEKVSPMRHDPPGAVTEMPRPNKLHHIHIFSDVNYDAMVAFYKRVLNTEVIRAVEGKPTLTFLSFDELTLHSARCPIRPRTRGAAPTFGCWSRSSWEHCCGDGVASKS